MEHSSSTYYNLGCRCDLCRAAATVFQRKQRERRYAERELINGRMVATKSRRHGKASIYRNWGCQCPPCTSAHTVNVRERRRKEQ